MDHVKAVQCLETSLSVTDSTINLGSLFKSLGKSTIYVSTNGSKFDLWPKNASLTVRRSTCHILTAGSVNLLGIPNP